MDRKEYRIRCGIFMFMLVLFIYGSLYQFTANHELVHYKVWEYMGCESNMTVYPGWGFVEPDCSMANMTQLEYLFAFEANNINEVGGYNTAYLGFLMGGFFMIYIALHFMFPGLFRGR